MTETEPDPDAETDPDVETGPERETEADAGPDTGCASPGPRLLTG